MDIATIQGKINSGNYVYSLHADRERKHEGLTWQNIITALFAGRILEDYPDTGRGESCLVVGFSGTIPIHVVCGWREDDLVIITVYIPCPPKFIDPFTRREKS